MRRILFFMLVGLLTVSAYAADMGIVRGQFKYPGKKVPSDLEVCAREIHTDKIYCTKAFTKEKAGALGYAGKIPVGNYMVLARSAQPNTRAGYFTTQVHCEGADCKSHQRIVVHLLAGQDLPGIDPDDWTFKEAEPGTDVILNEFKVGDYRFRSRCDQSFYLGYTALYKEKEEIFRRDQCGQVLSFAKNEAEQDEKSFHMPVIKDITGTGVNSLAIQFYSGGAHCCYSHTVLSLFNPIQTILKTHDYGEGNPLENPGEVWESNAAIQFIDLQKKGIYNIMGRDETFDYWEGPYSVTMEVRPKVIFEFQNGRYVLSLDLMKKDAPTTDAFNEKVNKVSEKLGNVPEMVDFQDKRWSEGGVPPELWGTMLQYIYTGHADLAWKFYDRVWGDNRAGKKEFLEAFKKQLEKSPYWPAVKTMTSEKHDEKPEAK